jgi:hypothetical protein
MLVYTFSQSVIVADYLINIEYLTKVFCVNKEKPQMKCNGKCHLAKELQKDEEKKSRYNPQKAIISTFYYLIEVNAKYLFYLPSKAYIAICS